MNVICLDSNIYQNIHPNIYLNINPRNQNRNPNISKHLNQVNLLSGKCLFSKLSTPTYHTNLLSNIQMFILSNIQMFISPKTDLHKHL